MFSHPLFDLSTPGAVEDLIAFHRTVFGDARMETDGAGDGTNDDANGGARTDPPKPTPPPRRDDADPGDRSDSDAQLGDAGKKALESERKAARAERARAEKAERELEEMRRQQMTEQERVVAERDDWRNKYEQQSATLAARELAILRTEIATERGLTLAQARRLIGTTREELEADADAFKSELPSAPPQSPYPPNTPRPDPSQGPSGSPGGRATSVEDAKAEHLARITKRAPN